MTSRDAISTLSFHAALAGTMWILAAIACEALLPGFVTPFVNLPMVILAAFILDAVAVSITRPNTHGLFRRILGIALVLILLIPFAAGIWIVWDGMKGSGYVLIVGGVLVALWLVSIFQADS